MLPAMEIDRLSALPDDLLVHILHRIPAMDQKEAAKKTAALSKRWRFIWTKLPRISFWNTEKGEIGRSYARIREALAARRKASLEHCCSFSMYLFLYYVDAFADDLVALLDFAGESRVRGVDLKLTFKSVVRPVFNPSCTLPEALYSYPSLEKLYLHGFKLVPPATSTVEWGLMTVISLYSVELPQQALDQIVSGCPLLNYLNVYACSGFNRLDVPGQRFRELYVGDGGGCSELLEISAPYMTTLNVFMDPRLTTLRLTDVSSVEQVDIHSWFCDGEMESFWNNEQLVQLLQRVTSLGVEFEFIQVLSNMRKDGWQLPQYRVQHLIIKDCIDTDNMAGVLVMLESSPFLDKLVIINEISKNKNYWNPSVSADLICDLLRLKTVEICVDVDLQYTHEMSFTLARILLRRAPVLQEMVIIVEDFFESADCIELVEKFKTLLNYPKSSQKAVVQIRRMY